MIAVWNYPSLWKTVCCNFEHISDEMRPLAARMHYCSYFGLLKASENYTQASKVERTDSIVKKRL
jgi:hypothetical protein